MKKSELIEELAEKTGLSVRRSAVVVATIIEAMSEALERGDNIEIRGFGSFKVKDYDPYLGRNPKTGEKLMVAAKRMPFFKTGKELRTRLNSGGS